jgi:ribonuclease P/MRP protein subunit POP1
VEDTKPWLFNSILASHLKLISREDPASHLLAAINEFRKNRALPALDAESGDKLLRTGLCHVEVESIGRGSPSDMAMLSFITGEERREWLEAFESDARGGDDFDPIRPSESAMLRVRI